MKVFFLPSFTTTNPYQELLERSLRKLGVDVEYRSALPSIQWLLKNRYRRPILHLHWPVHLYAWRRQQSLESRTVRKLQESHRAREILLPWGGKLLMIFREWAHFANFIGRLFTARLLKYKVVWTVHNLMPHEPLAVDFLGRFALAIATCSIIVHCEYTRRELAKQFLRTRHIHTIPHGHFMTIYPNSATRETARAKLGIPSKDVFVYLYFGMIRPYKQVEKLIEEFERLQDENAILIIAGMCRDEQQKKGLLKQTNGKRQIKMFIEFIPDQDVQYFFTAADVLVTPYSKVLNSGSIILGLSFGIPVIAPAYGCLPELISSEYGMLYDPHDKNGLFDALQAIKHCPIETMGQNACNLMQSDLFDWDTIAAKTYQVYMPRSPKELSQ